MNARAVSNIKKQTVEFELGGKIYELALTLNVIEEIQRIKGDLGDALTDALGSVTALKEIYLLIFNDAVENHNEDHPEDRWERFTPERLGRRLNQGNIEALQLSLFDMMGVSLPEPPETKGGAVTDEMTELLAEVEDPEEPDGKNGNARDA